MTPPDPGDAANPFQSLLGDLMNMLGSNGPDQWEMTRAFALNVATGGTPEANVEPLQRIQVEQLSRVAELNVIEATGMPVTPDGRRLTCVPVGRGDWTVRALESWRAVLQAMAAPPPGPRRSPARPAPRPAHRASTRWATTPPGGWPPCSDRWPPPSGRCSSDSRSARSSATWPSAPSASTRWPSRGHRRTSCCWSRPTSPSSPRTGACPRRRPCCGCAPGSWRRTRCSAGRPCGPMSRSSSWPTPSRRPPPSRTWPDASSA